MAPESPFCPSCSFSFFFGMGPALANEPDAATHKTSAIMKASSRYDNFTVILLFRNVQAESEMSRRPPLPPETATYARFQRKGRPDLYLRLRRSWLPGGRTAAGTHKDGRTRWDHLFAKAVS